MEVTIIVPIHKIEENDNVLIKRAFNSIKGLEKANNASVMVIGPSSVLETAQSLYEEVGCKQEVTYIENEECDFDTQVNKAVMACLTPYFSVLEFDDMYTPCWFTTADKYLKENKSLSVMLPITELINKDGNAISFANEIAWSVGFNDNDKLGVVDLDSLETFMDFNVTGAIIKTEDFISIGKLKKSLKLASWYEYLLRSAHKSKNIYVIPCTGYQHYIDRDGSYMVESHKAITPEEGQWLIQTAKQEYFFTEDRNKKFGEE